MLNKSVPKDFTVPAHGKIHLTYLRIQPSWVLVPFTSQLQWRKQKCGTILCVTSTLSLAIPLATVKFQMAETAEFLDLLQIEMVKWNIQLPESASLSNNSHGVPKEKLGPTGSLPRSHCTTGPRNSFGNSASRQPFGGHTKEHSSRSFSSSRRSLHRKVKVSQSNPW